MVMTSWGYLRGTVRGTVPAGSGPSVLRRDSDSTSGKILGISGVLPGTPLYVALL